MNANLQKMRLFSIVFSFAPIKSSNNDLKQSKDFHQCDLDSSLAPFPQDNRK